MFLYYCHFIFHIQIHSIYKGRNFQLEEPIAFAVGFSVDNNNTNIDDISKLLKIKFQFSSKHDQKEENGKNETNNETLDSYPCEKKDFYNKHDIAFDKLHINNFNCLKKNDLQSPEGIYTDEIFSYFKISVESQDKDNETHNQLINDYLTEHDCKLQFYYTDIAIDINNKEPFSSFLNSMFLQLNPTIIQKKNVFFMNYHLLDDDLLIHFNQNEEKEVIKTGLSRVEDYSVYKGLDRAIKKVDDYAAYAKIYIRTDNRKVVIKRRYQDIMEFYADASSLLSAIFSILGIIFAYYDRIKANHSISK